MSRYGTVWSNTSNTLLQGNVKKGKTEKKITQSVPIMNRDRKQYENARITCYPGPGLFVIRSSTNMSVPTHATAARFSAAISMKLSKQLWTEASTIYTLCWNPAAVSALSLVICYVSLFVTGQSMNQQSNHRLPISLFVAEFSSFSYTLGGK